MPRRTRNTALQFPLPIGYDELLDVPSDRNVNVEPNDASKREIPFFLRRDTGFHLHVHVLVECPGFRK